VYWRDSGLLHALLNVSDKPSLISQPWDGASWEGFVIEQIVGELVSQGKNFEAYYFRTSDQYELDLVLDLGAELWAIEVKLSSSPTRAPIGTGGGQGGPACEARESWTHGSRQSRTCR